jgi:hypothetical protein
VVEKSKRGGRRRTAKRIGDVSKDDREVIPLLLSVCDRTKPNSKRYHEAKFTKSQSLMKWRRRNPGASLLYDPTPHSGRNRVGFGSIVVEHPSLSMQEVSAREAISMLNRSGTSRPVFERGSWWRTGDGFGPPSLVMPKKAPAPVREAVARRGPETPVVKCYGRINPLEGHSGYRYCDHCGKRL